MNKHLRILLLVVISVSLLSQVNGQTNKPKTATKTQKSKDIPLPPPKAEQKAEEPDLPPPPMVDIATGDTIVNTVEPELDSAAIFGSLPKPMIDFDTTAVADDAFTKDILKLLEITNAMNLGALFAEELSKDQVQNNPTLKEFYTRFMADMRGGRMRRWMERMYVREYRKFFTQSEIQELLKFYDTQLGRKLVRSMHELLPSVMAQGKLMGEYIGAHLYLEIMKEGN